MMTITLYYEQMSHTIEQVLHRAGARVQDLDVRDTAQLDDSLSDQQLVRRLIRTGIARVKVLLRDALSSTSDTGDDLIRMTEASWSFGLDLNGDGQSMADLLHWFVCWRAIGEIAPSLGLEDLSSTAKDSTEEAESLIKDELVALSMPVKTRRALLRPTDYTPNITLQ